MKRIIILFLLCSMFLIGCSNLNMEDKTNNENTTSYEELQFNDSEYTWNKYILDNKFYPSMKVIKEKLIQLNYIK